MQAFDREEGAIVASQHGQLPGDAAQRRDRPEDVREGDGCRLALPRGARLHLYGRREHRRVDGEAEKRLLQWARGAVKSTEARSGGSGAGARLDLSVDEAERRVLEVEHAEQQRLEGPSASRWWVSPRLQGCTAGPKRPDSAAQPKGPPLSAPAPRAVGGQPLPLPGRCVLPSSGAASCVAWMKPSLSYRGG